MPRIPKLLVAVLILAASTAWAGPPEVHLTTDGQAVVWDTNFEFGTADLALTGPRKFATLRPFAGGERPYFEVIDELGKELPEGRYRWEVTYISPIDAGLREEIAQARVKDNEEFVCELIDTGVIQSHIFSGSFLKVDGRFVLPVDEEEKAVEAALGLGRESSAKPAAGTSGAPTRGAEKDFLINDDLIVDGSACIGFDCVNGEVFGFDTLRLKENNLRIKFDDTSVVGSYPRNDWQLTANDSANGGASKFSIDDISGGRTPFTVEAGARNHALYVDSSNNIGIGTATPVADLHAKTGDTPTLRLEQDGTSGFQPQTWDLAGNETSFFVRDATNGSTLPFRIRPTAPSNALVIDKEGEIGIGVLSADAKVHINGVDDGTQALSMDFANSSTGSTWFFQNDQDTSFKISLEGSGGAEITINDRQDGNANGDATLQVDGSVDATNVNFMSARDSKTAFTVVDTAAVLRKLAEIPIQEWRYKTEPESIRHMGPIAEDFSAAFGLGANEKRITVTDVNGVALAAIQALHEEMRSLRARVHELEAELEVRRTADTGADTGAYTGADTAVAPVD